MKKIFFLFFFHLLSIPFAFAQEAKDVVKKADEKAKGKTSVANITIQTIRPTWSREMSVKGWTKGNDLTLILVLAPAKEKGVVFLKRKKEVWNWIPSIERSIKMPPSMMNQIWMGTDFTNDDLVKEANFSFIYSPEKNTLIFVPTYAWNVVTNFDLDFTAQSFFSEQNNSYKNLITQIYIRGRWSF